MITEKQISKQIGRSVKSPIRVGSVADLKIDVSSFLHFFKPFFSELQDDAYVVRGKQVAFLKTIFTKDASAIEKQHKAYFEGTKTYKLSKQTS